MEKFDTEKYDRAKRRMAQLKGFYIHATVYTVINTFILVNIYVNSGYDGGSFWRFEHFFTLFFWGIGLLVHGAKTFGFNPFFGKNWEERQIQKYMDADKKESEKFKKR